MDAAVGDGSVRREKSLAGVSQDRGRVDRCARSSEQSSLPHTRLRLEHCAVVGRSV